MSFTRKLIFFILLLIVTSQIPYVFSQDKEQEDITVQSEQILQKAISSLKKDDTYIWCLPSFCDNRIDNYIITFSRLIIKGVKEYSTDKTGEITRKNTTYTTDSHSSMKVYLVEKGSAELKPVYEEVIVTPMGIFSFPKGFELVYHSGMGRRFCYNLYHIENKRIFSIFSESYDIVEYAYLPGEKGLTLFSKLRDMPYIFCTNLNNCFQSTLDNISYAIYAQYTDVYEWDEAKSKYILIKTITYEEETAFKDRFSEIKEGPVILLKR